MSRYIEQTNLFKRQLRLMNKRGKDQEKVFIIIKLLANDKTMDAQYKDHLLVGNFNQCRECHIEPDWLLIYRLTADNGLQLVETGSHSDLFG
jgi:mRNA interferase YafQ